MMEGLCNLVGLRRNGCAGIDRLLFIFPLIHNPAKSKKQKAKSKKQIFIYMNTIGLFSRLG